MPPGAPVPRLAGAASPRSATSQSGTGVTSPLLNAECYGVWPSIGGQSIYLPNCYGHDEPGINPYSPLPGSGGNVTWNVTLPVDRSPTQNQSDLYAAIWFGMTLSDKYAWMDQCFLELQFYPDSSWTLPGNSSVGLWNGAAVAWQIDASTGVENPCYYAPLTVAGSPSTYFEMTQGDRINVTMSGWQTSPFGENISIVDVTQGIRSFVNLVDPIGNFPLNPAYLASDFPNSLQWTPGGELPVAFSFETGHAGNPGFPTNSSFGGCSPGVPPPSPTNPAVPCPSYDPGAWSNDTLVPWKIATPVFFNAQVRAPAVQVGFTQDLGAIAYVSSSSAVFATPQFGCSARLGTAYCSYPWYSYSCLVHAYEFGATSYPETSNDFGKYFEYNAGIAYNGLGLSYYPPSNVSQPACGRPSVTLGVGVPTTAPTGRVAVLRTSVGSSTRFFPGLLAGNYSIQALPAPGAVFQQWVVTGGAHVANSLDPWTSVWLNADGHVNASFTTSPTGVSFTFHSSPAGGRLSLAPGFALPVGGLANPSELTLTDGQSTSLATGIYGIAAYGPAKANFSTWSIPGGAASIAAPQFPFTWLDLNGSSSVGLTASFVASASNATVLVFPFTGGNMTIGGTFVPGAKTTILSLPVGTYSIVAQPSASFSDYSWSWGGSAVIANNSGTTFVTLEGGTSIVYPDFFTRVAVTINTSAPTAGAVSFNGSTPATLQVVHVDWTNAGGAAIAGLSAVPLGKGSAFFNWTSKSKSSVSFSAPSSPLTSLFVLSPSAQFITGHFTVGSAYANLTVRSLPSGGSFVASFVVDNGTALADGSVAAYLGTGVHDLRVIPPAGEVFVNASTNGPASILSTSPRLTVQPLLFLNMNPSGAGASATLFVTLELNPPHPWSVTFVADSPSGAFGTVNGVPLTSDGTLQLTNGSYPLAVTVGANETFAVWASAGGVSASGGASGAVLTVNGPGTVYALTQPYTGPVLSGLAVLPSTLQVLTRNSILLTAAPTCAGGVSCPTVNLTWLAFPPTLATLSGTSGPSVTLSAANHPGELNLTLSGSLAGGSWFVTDLVRVLPRIAAVAVSPTNAAVLIGDSQSFYVSSFCQDNFTCVANTNFTWSLNNTNLGTLDTSTGSTVVFTPNSVPGVEKVTAQGEMFGDRVLTSVDVSVQFAALVLLDLSPTVTTVDAGHSVVLSTTTTCENSLPCPAGTQFAWNLTGSYASGSLNATAGPSVRFSAVAVPGTVSVSVTASLNGVSLTSLPARINVVYYTALVSATISPASASVAAGGSTLLSLQLTCNPTPCAAGVRIEWGISSSLDGVLTTGATPGVTSLTPTQARFTSNGTSSTVIVYANASWNSSVVHANPATLTIGGGLSSSTGGFGILTNPWFWVAVGVVLVVVVGMVTLLRRPPPPPTELVSDGPGDDGEDPQAGVFDDSG